MGATTSPLRTCSKCHAAKPLSDFYQRTTGGHRPECKSCTSLIVARARASPDKYEKSLQYARISRQRRTARRRAEREEDANLVQVILTHLLSLYPVQHLARLLGVSVATIYRWRDRVVPRKQAYNSLVTLYVQHAA